MQINELVGNVVDLEGLLTYQKGAVVSRTVIDKKIGTVTIFAFDEGQGLSEHTAPYDALIFLIDGEGVVNIAGEEHKIKKGEMIIMPANKPHSVKATKKFKMALVMIRA